ncbi:50S ribosomal protein L10 [Mycoplasma sp. CH-Wi4]|uniref:Large ribosomal subunit protein uL10 n=1 Tax=Mycoplasma tauri TaxID=547987 RepID=A0A953NGT5_9MOLU|nr:50S ribosomal protein L10 [Mycoplasma tauri]MBZ4195416.1 50S ribosomal protein L10 [Mycoplasma tauri]MBZ4203520.1 50S ribosomal protein L10 [Mycoplasma tauri]MBZ4204398.1 50S ribosomal protein L10 [Mycoplasma tauri]MBZ4212670.1 50S ribosomal protein L10 [Mycoplasma tauri]MBZ4218062.1 50S ribosomal protein L10 [Mycoplasma tauri]
MKPSKNRLAKIETVREISEKIQSSKGLIIAEYRGLTVAELKNLRVEAKKAGIEIKVYKNRLFKLAAREVGYDLDEHLVGPNLFAFSNLEDNAAAKVLVNFAKTNKLLLPKAGIFENQVIDTKTVAEVASLPNYEEALTILARSLMSPLQQLSLSLKLFSEKESQ